MYEYELYFKETDETKIAYARKATDLPKRYGYNPKDYVIVSREYID